MITWKAVLLAVPTAALAACGASNEAPAPEPEPAKPVPEEPAPEEPAPILSRTATPLYDCSVARGLTGYAPLNWGWSGHSLVVTPARDIYLPRIEFEGNSWSPESTKEFVVSKLLADGTLGPRRTVPAAAEDVYSISAAPRDDGLAAVWMEGSSLRFAAFDGSANLVVQPKTIPTPNLDPSYAYPSLVSRGTDFALTFATGQGTDEFLDASFLVLDHDGNARGPIRKLHGARNDYGALGVRVLPTAAGYTLAWLANETAGFSFNFRTLDPSGADVAAPTRAVQIESPHGLSTGFALPVVDLLEVQGGYLATWAVYNHGEYDYTIGAGGGSGGWGVVHVARLDEQGRPRGLPAVVRPIEEHVDEVEPSLRRFGDAVALSWSRGSHIYVCGGCMPDHRIDTVLIDPGTLDPISDVVTVEKRADHRGGGLLGREAVVIDDTITMAFEQQYHVHSDPGTAALRCARR